MGNVLPFIESKDSDDEKHVHPLQKDVIERACVLESNPGETVLTPFMGVGSEVCGALAMQRRAIGMELKSSYYRQAVKNVDDTLANNSWEESTQQSAMFDDEEPETDD